MAITILERLHDVKPCGRNQHVKNPSLKVIYDLVRRHLAEIEEARARGYSWRQVDRACRESWQEFGDSASSIVWWRTPELIADAYHRVKREATVGKKSQKGKKPLQLEVQITKR